MTFQLYDDTSNECHGVFDTAEDARGAAAFDRLTHWTIYSAGEILESAGHYDTRRTEEATR